MTQPDVRSHARRWSARRRLRFSDQLALCVGRDDGAAPALMLEVDVFAADLADLPTGRSPLEPAKI